MAKAPEPEGCFHSKTHLLAQSHLGSMPLDTAGTHQGKIDFAREMMFVLQNERQSQICLSLSRCPILLAAQKEDTVITAHIIS